MVYGTDAGTASSAAAAAFARMATIDAALSDWSVGSPVSQLRTASAKVWIEVGPVLDASLALAEQAAVRTGGGFDVACGRMTAQWRQARRRGTVPDDWRAWTARHGPGRDRITLRPGGIRFGEPVPWLDFGGIGKGIAADQALAVLRAAGFDAALVDVGGELALGDPPPGRPGWRVTRGTASNGSGEAFVLANCGVATSGAGEQSITGEREAASHVIDPRTGIWLGAHDDVTVVAPTAAEADALASAGCVLGVEGLRAVLVDRQDVQVH